MMESRVRRRAASPGASEPSADAAGPVRKAIPGGGCKCAGSRRTTLPRVLSPVAHPPAARARRALAAIVARPVPTHEPRSVPRPARSRIQGVAVAPGLALGSVHIVLTGPADVPTWTVKREDVPLEIGRLATALNLAAQRLEERQRAVSASAGAKDAEIFAVHR